MEKVIIRVLGGIAEVYDQTDNVIVKIIDFDNEPNATTPELSEIEE